MRTMNFSTVLRTKLGKGIYSFDVIAVRVSDLQSSLIGYCIVKTGGRRNLFDVHLNWSVELSYDEKENIGKKALAEAEKIEAFYSE